MPTITFDVTAAIANEIADGLGYEAQVSNPNGDGSMVPNPESRQTFVKRVTMGWWRGQVLNNRHRKAAEVASAGVDEAVPIT